MSRPQRWTYRIEPRAFPEDFPERLERLRAARGLSWRGLARELRINARSLRRWRSGGRPDAASLLHLLTYAYDYGLERCLIPEQVEDED